jgi:hypothetical protein
MILSLRAMLIPLTTVLLFAGVGFTCPQWTAHYGVDFWNYSRYEDEVLQNLKEMESFNEIGVQVRQRLFLKIAITQELISKRIDLAQATDQFLELNKVDPEILPSIRRRYPAATPEESVSAQVIDFVRTELKSDPSRLRETIGELERQRQENRQRYAIQSQ